jgi:hypothetical protein
MGITVSEEHTVSIQDRNVMMAAVFPTKLFVTIYQTTRCNNPQDRNLNHPRHENTQMYDFVSYKCHKQASQDCAGSFITVACTIQQFKTNRP